MSGKSDKAKTKAPSADAPTADAVTAYLKRNPSFLNDRPDLIAALVPPEFDHGGDIVDLQRFMLERMRDDHTQMAARERVLLDAAEANARTQARVHAAIRALLAPRSFEGLIGVVSEELPKLFEIRAASLCVETGDPLPGNAGDIGVILIPPGTLDELFAGHNAVVLRPEIQGDKAIFGRKAARIRSVALMRLDFGEGAPRGMLALGSTEPREFDPRQGTELLSFFAHVLQHRIRRWLNRPD
ncbi:MAG: DUF484 family protein [Alphaproteobacteria bacterium]